jgi:hypothetical protein
MSLDIDLVEDGEVAISLVCSATVVRFFARTGPGDANLHLSDPVPRTALVELKKFLDVHLADDEPDEPERG